MRSIRLIPCLDVEGGRVVKGVRFAQLQDAGDPVELGRLYSESGADELVFLDISASHEGRRNVVNLAERVAERVFIPFTVGGGLRSTVDIRAALLAGADKVSLNTAAVENPSLVGEAAELFGSQCVVVAIDAKRTAEGKWEVYTRGGRRPTGKDAVQWAQHVAMLGAGEILLTSIDRDGTRTGYDVALTRAIADAVPIPVIASGGAGDAQHLVNVVVEGHADAVLLAGILHEGKASLHELKAYMHRSGLPVRLN